MKKRWILLLAAMLAAVIVLSACADKANEKTADANVSGTDPVIETTADGGTVEQDADGNRITRDPSGTVVKVQDSDGNPLDVDEYLKDHPSAQHPAPDSSQTEPVEDEIPLVIATIPDDDDELIEIFVP